MPGPSGDAARAPPGLGLWCPLLAAGRTPLPAQVPSPEAQMEPGALHPVPQQGSAWWAPVHSSPLDTEALVRIAPHNPCRHPRRARAAGPKPDSGHGAGAGDLDCGSEPTRQEPQAGPCKPWCSALTGVGGPVKAAPSEKWWPGCSATSTPGGDTGFGAAVYLAEADMPRTDPRHSPNSAHRAGVLLASCSDKRHRVHSAPHERKPSTFYFTAFPASFNF